jgi:hypothetical protein
LNKISCNNFRYKFIWQVRTKFAKKPENNYRNIDPGTMLRFSKYFRRKIWRKFRRFLLKLPLVFLLKYDHSIGFWEKRQIFRRKLAKVAEICDRNIGPRTVSCSTLSSSTRRPSTWCRTSRSAPSTSRPGIDFINLHFGCYFYISIFYPLHPKTM